MERTTIFENEQVKMIETGRDYDFIATITNKTNRTMKVKVDCEDYIDVYEIQANSWVGVLADKDGWTILKKLKEGKFELDNSTNDLIKDKIILLSTTDGESDFILIVNKNDYSQAAMIIEKAKEEYYGSDSDGLFSDMVCNLLEAANIEAFMPDFEEL